jgi:hypothetical protein
VSTLREDVLRAFERLERRHGRTTFDLVDVIAEVLREHPDRVEVSVRTHIVSVMCKDAPVHHSNHTNELERVGRGRYRRVVAAAPTSGNGWEAPTAGKRMTLATTVWPWEGAVQAVFVAHLERDGWTVTSEAHTAGRSHGHDVIAERNGERLIAEVKGFPFEVYQRGPKAGERKKPGGVPTQARVWFAHALMSAMMMRGDEPNSRVVIAAPNVTTYRQLARRCQAACDAARIEVVLLDQPTR